MWDLVGNPEDRFFSERGSYTFLYELLLKCANNKGIKQLVHAYSLISLFVCLLFRQNFIHSFYIQNIKFKPNLYTAVRFGFDLFIQSYPKFRFSYDGFEMNLISFSGS